MLNQSYRCAFCWQQRWVCSIRLLVNFSSLLGSSSFRGYIEITKFKILHNNNDFTICIDKTCWKLKTHFGKHPVFHSCRYIRYLFSLNHILNISISFYYQSIFYSFLWFCAIGGQYFRLNDNANNSKQFSPQDLPSNMEEVNAAEKSTTYVDR